MSLYGWGDDSGESRKSDSGSASSGGYDYTSARKAYEEPTSKPSSGGSRIISEGSPVRSSRISRDDDDFSSAKGKTPHPIKREKLSVVSTSTHPIVVCVDHTGSFQTEVKVIVKKLPLFGTEVSKMNPDYQICFSLIGDTTSDRQPFQVQDFDSGPALDDRVACLFPECDGGDAPESYDLAAYYFTKHCETPNAVIKPIFIFVLDETTRPKLYGKDVREYIGDDIYQDLDSVEVLKALSEKFSVYVIVRYDGKISFWEDIYGVQRIIKMEEPSDIIELFIGIVSGELGRIDEFIDSVSGRHSDRPDRVSRVMKSMKSFKSASDTKAEDGKSVKAGTPGTGSMKSVKSKKLV
ncbi:MAG: hypothetical protein Q7T50_02375 [Candidatus Magasanikbacteria bacterium]|nr:hypothetical protein [Candidatus Magasanikbacteria bacterium]